jgi:hypothetical protein
VNVPVAPCAAPAALALISDTHALDAPASLSEFSSHLLLWEKLRAAILLDPFCVAAEPKRG